MNPVCVMRDIYKSLATYEHEFEATYCVSLNEAMVLCALSCSECKLSSSEISDKTAMTASHTSKVIKTVETKALIKRTLGKDDKRQMYFSLTAKGTSCLSQINCKGVEIPDMLKPIFESKCSQE